MNTIAMGTSPHTIRALNYWPPGTGSKACVLAIFRRACLDCVQGSPEQAADAVLFLCSDNAENWATWLDVPVEDLVALARRCWAYTRARFHELTLDDLQGQGLDD